MPTIGAIRTREKCPECGAPLLLERGNKRDMDNGVPADEPDRLLCSGAGCEYAKVLDPKENAREYPDC